MVHIAIKRVDRFDDICYICIYSLTKILRRFLLLDIGSLAHDICLFLLLFLKAQLHYHAIFFLVNCMIMLKGNLLITLAV